MESRDSGNVIPEFDCRNNETQEGGKVSAHQDGIKLYPGSTPGGDILEART